MAFPSGSPIYDIAFQQYTETFNSTDSFPPFADSFLNKTVIQSICIGEQVIEEVQVGLEPGTQYWG